MRFRNKEKDRGRNVGHLGRRRREKRGGGEIKRKRVRKSDEGVRELMERYLR